jgi:cellulose synthase/poly-beta-1,6-N-acetylglucosamine synthase-like glycosyltransferase
VSRTGDSPTVSVVIPVRDGEGTIGDCLTSVLATDYPVDRREVVVVDNGSRDGTAAAVARFPVRRVSELREGVAHARNRGIAESSGEIVAFIDSDNVATTRWLDELVRPFDDPEVGAVAGEVVPYPPRTPSQRHMARIRARRQKDAIESDPPFIAAGNAAFRRKVFEAIGPFDPFFVTGEDKDICWRLAARSDLRLHYAPRALVLGGDRATAWGLFRQSYGWGVGTGLLRSRYEGPPLVRNELARYRELAAAAGRVAKAAAGQLDGKSTRPDLEEAYLVFLRRLGQRAGVAAGIVRAALASRDHVETGGKE